MDVANYDLVVIGSGPAGQKGAIAAAKLGKKVALIDRKEMVGGVCLHTGTIPSKTLREAILYLSGFRERTFYGRDYTVSKDITVTDLAFRVQKVLVRELEVIRAQLNRNRVTTLSGTARFVDGHTLEIESAEGATRVRGEHILIACGTRPAHNETVPLDGKRIIDSDQLLKGENLPRDLIVVGAGVIGLEYASMMSALNIKVTVIEARPTVLDFVDREMIDSLMYFMRQRGAAFRLGEKVERVGYDEKGRVVAFLESGKEIHGDTLLYTVGRCANGDLLNLGAAGIEADARGKVAVNEFFQTSAPHIYAAGDVIGFPALASTSMEQGRLASCHMFGTYCEARKVIPYGIYTIPGDLDRRQDRAGADGRESPLRDRRLEVRRARQGPDARRRHGDAQDPLRPQHPQASRRAHLRRARDRDHPHRPGRHRLRRHDRLLPRHRLQLPHHGRGVQSRRPRRPQSLVVLQSERNDKAPLTPTLSPLTGGEGAVV